ncbi:MAG: GNAT family N-acetyltransferase [Oligoflexales bacterium]
MENYIELLRWDSDFFDLKIGKIIEDPNLEESVQIAKDQAYRLVYCYVSPKDEHAKKTVEKYGGVLVDRRVMYAQQTNPAWKDILLDSKLYSGMGSEMSSDLENLAIACGHHSRFCIDEKIPHDLFEKMYSIWIQKSLEGQIAAEVFLYGDQEGLCTVRDLENRADIGLIGVHETLRGQGVGRKMMCAAMSYAAKRDFPALQVATQVDNVGACAFYENLGFQVDHRVDIYHLWL